MKAALFDKVGRPLRIEVTSDPTPAPDEVILRIEACGICGSDLHITEDPVTFGIGQGAVLGDEFADEVVALGTAVTTLRQGDGVAVAPMWGCGFGDSCRRGEPAWCAQMRLIGGGHADFSTVAARQCRVLPPDLPLAECALAEPVAVGMPCVIRSGVKPGAKMLIPGAGPIGLTVAFRARRMGAAEVIVADLNRHQEARAAAVGATGFAISGPGLADELQGLIGGAPDIVFECVGKRGLIDAAIGLVQVQVHGTVVGAGLCVGGDVWDAFRAIPKEVSIVMSVFFTMAEFSAAIDALGGGRFRPQSLITDRISRDRLPDTFGALRRRTTQCKVLVGARSKKRQKNRGPLKRNMMDFETLTYDIDGVKTIVKAIGSGLDVLALHGAATLEGHQCARGLADRFRVLLPFHPGFGESGDAPHVVGMQDMVVHYLTLIDVMDLSRPHLMGHSMGSWMAAELAVVADDRFAKLVLNAPAGLKHPDHPATDLGAVPPQELQGYLAHHVDVALRCFPGGSDCPPLEQFLAGRAREGAALGNIL